MDSVLGQRFDYRHGGGVTRYVVDRKHRDAGYYECVAVRAVEGSHTTVGAIQVFSRASILAELDRECREIFGQIIDVPMVER